MLISNYSSLLSNFFPYFPIPPLFKYSTCFPIDSLLINCALYFLIAPPAFQLTPYILIAPYTFQLTPLLFYCPPPLLSNCSHYFQIDPMLFNIALNTFKLIPYFLKLLPIFSNCYPLLSNSSPSLLLPSVIIFKSLPPLPSSL